MFGLLHDILLNTLGLIDIVETEVGLPPMVDLEFWPREGTLIIIIVNIYFSSQPQDHSKLRHALLTTKVYNACFL